MPNIRKNIDKKELKVLYWQKYWSAHKIATKFDCTYSTIINRLKEYKIPLKNSSLARQRYLKKDFSGDGVEKAYLLGFRIGDLNVYKTNPRAETVIVRCHTTDKNQIILIKNCFKNYGKVTISERKGHFHINCFLNKSFSFLLKKFKKPPINVKITKEIFAFIAGYTDAEGNFILNQGKARFKIDCYDKGVLFWIASKLKSQGIKHKIRQLGEKDKEYYNGRKLNSDLWRLNINFANDLLNFISEIIKHSKHKKRISQMKIAKNNVLQRLAQGTIK
ncbi:hypothetical protein A2V71_01015 [Candidatus Berkelbacteria bacterium RBG_13_40_8]|uniref:Homing endonuclease LAGLIDADG domain-containing protein n=1 Tax=Candidatus Berkelbacteria bacterium RBG_13_40_8 TaxID=1797467 RepID=A0A1F5DP69_9BACT|nr:MAG: hypothetical protein A2V71_01015 [Candidatus Berkelbacteria bacterium RBG_13_40_8]